MHRPRATRRADGKRHGDQPAGQRHQGAGELGAAHHVLAHGLPVRRRAYHNAAGRLLFSTDDEEFWRDVGPPLCLRHGHLLEALTLPPHEVSLEAGRATSAHLTSYGVESSSTTGAGDGSTSSSAPTACTPHCYVPSSPVNRAPLS